MSSRTVLRPRYFAGCVLALLTLQTPRELANVRVASAWWQLPLWAVIQHDAEPSARYLTSFPDFQYRLSARFKRRLRQNLYNYRLHDSTSLSAASHNCYIYNDVQRNV